MELSTIEMNENNVATESARDPVLNPVDRVSEMLFGLFMALTFVGAVSVAESGARKCGRCSLLRWAATLRGVSSTQ